MIVLVGFMGAGKSTVGRLLAARLGLNFVDTDDLIVRKAGKSIPEIFAGAGEPAFREIEREAALTTLEGPDAVVALGGGALIDPIVRTASQRGEVVFLDVSYGEAIRRTGVDANRPLLKQDPKRLYETRRPQYESAAKYVVHTDGRPPSEIAMEIAVKVAGVSILSDRPQRVVVPLGDRQYDVVVGSDLIDRIADLIPPFEDAEKAFMITHPSLERRCEQVSSVVEAWGLTPHMLTVPEGESSKGLDTVARLYEELAELKATRRDVVVGFGGGVVCDIAGFVAATYARGLPLLQVPTSFLAQVDAAIGGKNGVNLPQGKNLVGTFHQPRAVVCDVEMLLSLPREEMATGMAEVIKYGLISDPELIDVVMKKAGPLLEGSAPELIEVVARSASIKAHYVAADELDRGVRAHLNYGHTFAHAIEVVSGLGGISHGHAVSLGMMAAAHLAEEMGRITQKEVETHRRALVTYNLPVRGEFDARSLDRVWRVDKKFRKGVRFVLMKRIGEVEAGVTAPWDKVERAIARLAA